MTSHSYKPEGVCAKEITFDIDGDKIYNISIVKGCEGLRKSYSLIFEGKTLTDIQILESVVCGNKGTSCGAQLYKGVKQAFQNLES